LCDVFQNTPFLPHFQNFGFFWFFRKKWSFSHSFYWAKKGQKSTFFKKS
jgi:hypothetical protein